LLQVDSCLGVLCCIEFLFIITTVSVQGSQVQTRPRDGFLRVINIRSTPSFGGEVKPEASYCKILQHVKSHLQV
jgi:hypothetical protein